MQNTRLSSRNMYIPMAMMIAQLYVLALMPVIGGLESVIQSNESRPEMLSASSTAASFHNEIANLWKDLSVLSEKATSSITSDNRTQTVASSISAIDSLVAVTSNSTNSRVNPVPEDDDRSLIIGMITANIIIFVIGFCGNSLVIMVILRFTKIETVTDIYILNLAFADLMFLFGLVFLIITMFIDHWIFGNLMCKLYMATTSLNQFASSLLLVVMSFDRFLAVCHPIYAQRFRRLRRAKAICLCIWIVCLILMIPIFAFAKTNQELTCAIFWPEYKSFNCEKAFTLYSFAIGFAVPLLLIAGFYLCVIRKLRIAASGPINLGSRRSRSRETTNRRIEHLVIGIICTYTICWLPYWLSQLFVSFTSTLDRSPIDGFYPFILVATCLSYTNSALNPILYAFLSDNFKRRCSDVFRSITSIKWCPLAQTNETHSTAATTLYEASEANSCLRPESRQTVVMNESVRLVTSPSQLADIITTNMEANLGNNTNPGHSSNNGPGTSNHLYEPPQLQQTVLDTSRKVKAGLQTATEPAEPTGNQTTRSNSSNGRNSAHCYINQNNYEPIHSLEATAGNQNDETTACLSAAGSLLRKKSVAFNIESTIVVQKQTDEPVQSLIGDQRMLQVLESSKQQQQCQEAV